MILADIDKTGPRYVIKRPFVNDRSRFLSDNIALRGLGAIYDGEVKEWFVRDEQSAKRAALIVGGSYVNVNGPSVNSSASTNDGGNPVAPPQGEVSQGTQSIDRAEQGEQSEGDDEGDEAEQGDDTSENAEGDDIETENGAEEASGSTADDTQATPDDNDDPESRLAEALARVERLTARGCGKVAKALSQNGMGVGDLNRPKSDGSEAGMPMLARAQARLKDALKRLAQQGNDPQAFLEDVLGDTSDGTVSASASKPSPAQPKPAKIESKTLSEMLRDAPMAGNNEGDPLEDEFSKRQARAIRDAIEKGVPNVPPIDTDFIRMIAREEDASEENTALAARIKDIAEQEAQRGDLALLDTVSQGLADIETRIKTDLEARLASQPQADTVSLTPRTIQVQIAERPAVDATGMHYLAPMIAAGIEAGLHIGLVGPPGAGKTHVGKDVAKLLGRKFFGAMSLSGGVTESAILGRGIPSLTGEKGTYLASTWVNAFGGTTEHPNGGIILLDEADAADPNTALAFNMALANGGMFIEARTIGGLDAYVEQASAFGCLLGMNTNMQGQNAKFAGRQQQDAAFVDRVLLVDFRADARIVASLIGANTLDASLVTPMWTPSAQPFTQAERNEWCAWYFAVKTALDGAGAKGSSKTWSPRVLQKVDRARSAGWSRLQVLQSLFLTWKVEDRMRLLGDALSQGPSFTEGGLE